MPFLPPESAIRHQVERIFAVSPFNGSPLLRRFLTFVLDEMFAGRGNGLNQYSIGQHVFGFGDEFVPETNAVVRVNANRLRRALAKYYAERRQTEAILISMPVGGFTLSVVFGSRLAYKARLPMPAPVLALLEFSGIGLEQSWKQFPLLLSEELSVCLGRVSQLRLLGPIRRTGELEKMKERQPYQVIGAGVDFMVDGSVRQAGGDIEIQTHLLEGGTGVEIWSSSYRFPMVRPDIAEIETSLMRRVSLEVFEDFGAIDRHLSGLARVKSENSLTVFEAVLIGRMGYDGANSELFRRGCNALRRAIAQVPNEALPRATLACVLACACFQPFWQGDSPLAEVSDYANLAFEIDSVGRWSIIALGASAVIHHNRGELARIGKLVDSDPEAAKLLQGMTGVWMIFQKVDTGLGLRLIRRACDGNPHPPPSVHLGLALVALEHGDFPSVLLAMNDFGLPEDWRDPLVRGASSAFAGDLHLALDCWHRLLELYPDFASRGFRNTCRLWHEDYVRLLCQGLNRAGAGIIL